MANSPMKKGTSGIPSPQVVVAAEVEPQHPVHRAEADEGQQHADAGGHEPLEHVAAGGVGHRQEAEDHQHEELGGTEGQHDDLHEGEQDHQEAHAHHGAEEGRGRRKPNGPARLAAAGHGMAVKAGGGVGRLPRNVEQDRGNRPPFGGRPHHPRHQEHGGSGLPPEGEGHTDGQARQEQPGERPKDQAGHGADGEHQQVRRLAELTQRLHQRFPHGFDPRTWPLRVPGVVLMARAPKGHGRV